MIRLSQPTFDDEQIKLVVDVLKSGQLVQGNKVKEFEDLLSAYLQSPYVVVVNSGTAALHLSLLALGITKGDAVFVPAFTFPATANVVEMTGARTVLVDVDPSTYCMTAETLMEAMERYKGPEKPKAVIPVHEFGAPADMDGIMAVAQTFGLSVIEDAACALGTRCNGKLAGTIGDFGCFSFHPRKSITTGEGGAIVARDEAMYHRLKRLRNHGIGVAERGRMDFVDAGLNYRMTEFQAVLGISQMPGLDRILAVKKRIAEFYLAESASIPAARFPHPAEGHSWQTFMIVLPEGTDRSMVINGMHEHGIETNMGAQAVHMLTYYRDKYDLLPDDFPVSSVLYRQGLAIPIHERMSMEDAGKIVEQLRERCI